MTNTAEEIDCSISSPVIEATVIKPFSTYILTCLNLNMGETADYEIQFTLNNIA